MGNTPFRPFTRRRFPAATTKSVSPDKVQIAGIIQALFIDLSGDEIGQ